MSLLTRITYRLNVAVAATFMFAGAAMGQSTLLFHDVSVFDGVRSIGRRDVLVRDGKIAMVAANVATPAGATVIDGKGRTLAPGLIDAHTHAFGDALAQALQFGVTTELDMFSNPVEDARLRAEQRAGNVAGRADIYSAGFLTTVPKGHGTEYGIPIPTITSPDSAQAFVDARIAEGSDYIKIIYDDGNSYGMHIPTLTKETMAAVVRAAHARGKMAVAHIGSLAGAHDAIDAGVDGLEHLFVDQAPEPGFGAYVAAHHVFVVPTLTVLLSTTGVAPSEGIAADTSLTPYLSAAGRGTLGGKFPRFPATLSFANAEAAVKQLKAAGVPMLAGTDAPNPGTAHGIAIHRELELLVQAGLTPAEALAAATSTPARLFKLADRGRVAPGMRADLVLFDGDPTHDILATRRIAGIWKGGVHVERVRQSVSAAAQPVAPVATGATMVSNFEDGSARTSFGGEWLVTTDKILGGSSTASMNVVDGGANGTKKSLAITANVLDGAQYSWAGVIAHPSGAGMVPVNLSATKGIHFWAKGDGRTYHVMVFSASRGQIPMIADFVAGATWAEHTMPWSMFDGLDGHDVMGIAVTAGAPAGTYNVSIDEVELR